ncbi:hypothetical protein NEHOM01_1596 [Nematocida homosporus]|uniref:uncharacterized protein n=1 Tax=Nematocida homosporus TaxID=1912981 RepID=UPI0022202B5B|nr:uncharacterized protein NEHOM01_1596 [Nematocida homosporus]KAI5186628.1 hypothetical protein NEHOM01_1596 [Nematocida homosporus]
MKYKDPGTRETMLFMVLLIKAVMGYYIKESYRPNVVDVTRIERPDRKIDLCFVLENDMYSTTIQLDNRQRHGTNSYNAYRVVYTKKSAATGQSTPYQLKESFQEPQGWLMQELGSDLLSGVVIDEHRIIHIKPKEFLYSQADNLDKRSDLVAFRADDEVLDECIMLDDSGMNLGDDEIKQDYLEGVEEYFGRPQNQSKTGNTLEGKAGEILEKLKDVMPESLQKLLFWWRPISIHATTEQDSKKSYSEVDLATSPPKRYGLADPENQRIKCEECNIKRLNRIDLSKSSNSKDQPQPFSGQKVYPDIKSTHLPPSVPTRHNTSKPNVNQPNNTPAEQALEVSDLAGFKDEDHYYQVEDSNSLLEYTAEAVAKDVMAREPPINPTQTTTRVKTIKKVKDKLNGTISVTTEMPHANRIIRKGKKIYFGIPFYSKLSQIENAIVPNLEYGFPVETRAIPIAIALDKYFIAKNGSLRAAILFALETINTTSSIYERSFNVILYVNDIIIDKKAEWYHSTGDLLKKLEQFTEYRRHKNKDCMLYHLFTGDLITNKKIGLAWTGNIGYHSQKNISASVLIQNQFITVAHEIAHNLGLFHDCDEELCKDATVTSYGCHPCKGCDCNFKYIMSRRGTPGLLCFSPPSQREMSVILSQLEYQMPKADETIMPYPVCGNGIMERGKECDAGPFGDECCTPDCKLRPGAICSDANSKCCTKCQISPAGTICRSAANECQRDSICDGMSEKCPAPVFMPNRKKCSIGHCTSGMCINRDIQCTIAGDRMGIISSCPSHKGCAMKCVNLKGEAVFIEGRYFKNGTPCGWNGVCMQGRCNRDLKVAAMYICAVVVGVAMIGVYFYT